MTAPPVRRSTPPFQLSQEDPWATWEDPYASGNELELPWFSSTLDEEFDMALEHYSVRPKAGPVLDLGTGPGTAAIELARRGYEVVGLDVSQNAIKMARRRAGPLAKQVRWVCEDLFDAEFEAPFQMVYDRGLYHALDEGARKRYPEKVSDWVKSRGLLFLKAFSTQEPGEWGPHRIPQEEIRSHFARFFDVIKVEHVTFPGTLDHDPKADFYVLRRRAGERTI